MPFSNQSMAEAEYRVQEDVKGAEYRVQEDVEGAEENGDQDVEKPLEAEEYSSDFCSSTVRTKILWKRKMTFYDFE